MRRLASAVTLALLALRPAFSDLYSPDRPLAVTETEYFTIIYPEESRAAAAYLSTFADRAYREIAALLDTTPRYRMPVVITPDSEQLNGYFTWVPYPRIVLYQAPVDMNSTLGSFQDDLYKLFYHELTHAVSMTIRSLPEDVVAAIFGTPATLSPYLAPLSFVEGVTVSFESRDGHGRAVDPLAGAYVRQDIAEGRFKTFAQAMGAYDRYPRGGLYYMYGGYFSRYLQERFGLERYAELWRCFGIRYLLKPLSDVLGFPGRFREVFGVSLDEAWVDFGRWMAVRTPIVAAAGRLEPLSAVSALASDGERLYWHDGARGAVVRRDAATGESRELFRVAAEVSRLSVSPGGERVIVSTQREDEGFPRLVLEEWDEASGRLRELPFEGLREASYAPSAGCFAAIAIDGYATDLVLATPGGVRTLLRGSERLAYASPVVSADGRLVYALAKEGGNVTIAKLSLDAPLGSVAGVERLILPGELSWVRYLSLSDAGVLRFGWDDEAFYRLAELDGDALRYQAIPITGGVHEPVEAAGRVYYLGRFADGMAPCAFPADRAPLGMALEAAEWEDASALLSAPSVYDKEADIAARPYSVLPWLLPRAWFPAFSLYSGGFYAFGAAALIADPAERVSATASALWNAQAGGVDAAMELSYMRFAPTIDLTLEDAFKYDEARYAWYRASRASLGIRRDFGVLSGGSLGLGASVSLGASASLPATLPASGSPYVPWTDSALAGAAALTWSDATAPLADPAAVTGYALSIKAVGGMEILPAAGSYFAGAEAALLGYAGLGALRLAAYGAAGALGNVAYGPGGRVAGEGAYAAALYPYWREFAREVPGPWYAQGEASLRPLSTDIQANLGPLYLNRLSFRAGARAFAAGGESLAPAAWGWSAFCRAELTATPAIGLYAKIHPVLAAEFWFRPDRAEGAFLRHGLALTLGAGF